MIQLLDKPITSYRILHLEDNKLCLTMFKKIANSLLNNIRIKPVKDSMSFFCQLPFENPHLIIADWHLADGGIEFILDELSKFKGKVIFFSYLDINIIKDKIIKQLKNIPDNFIIMSKNDIDSYKKISQKIKILAKSQGFNI